ncbi:sensor histidine kinase [Miniphocaeibacter massiliensis]|uniref:sensor histidine kinase n=1 Tax=Miniphocaeibacter massiliensis TaxID=2041841 RepID=UPI000C08121D|nr:sensor histidine kinase [Miniphocaeibacter massiliensis]
MNSNLIIFFLCIVIVCLVSFVFYQRYRFKNTIFKEIEEIISSLESIIDVNDSEKVMVFTDNDILKRLLSEINRLLDFQRELRFEFNQFESSSKKMFSNISHDIKTPMTVILGYLEMMLLQDNISKETVLKVESKAKEVIELINKTFTLAKLEAGDTKMNISRVNLNEVCRESILDFYDILTSKDFEVDINIPESSIYTMGDISFINRILFNLISNVIRYGYDGKYLGLKLYADNSFSYIEVSDKGNGIDKQFASSVFDRLFTMEDSRNKEIEGNGLGLTIAKNFANKLGGDITLSSTPSVMTVFTVKLKKLSY